VPEVPNDLMSGLFSAAAEAAEEAIYNSLCCAVAVEGHRRVAHALPMEVVVAELRRRRALREVPEGGADPRS
jgi:L-aminopeptidase/D-esterase-like protein